MWLPLNDFSVRAFSRSNCLRFDGEMGCGHKSWLKLFHLNGSGRFYAPQFHWPLVGLRSQGKRTDRLVPHCVAAAHESMQHKICALQQINIWPQHPAARKAFCNSHCPSPFIAWHLQFTASLNLYLHLTTEQQQEQNEKQKQEQRQRQRDNSSNNTTTAHHGTTVERVKFVWLIFWLQIKSKIALKLHAAEKLCSQLVEGMWKAPK